jgi:hypothetical protein
MEDQEKPHVDKYKIMSDYNYDTSCTLNIISSLGLMHLTFVGQRVQC